MMIIFHIVENIIFAVFLVLNIIKIRKNESNIGKIALISFVLGCAVYIAYVVMLIADFKASGFDTQSFSLLILSWAFENVAYCTMEKKNGFFKI